VVETDGLRFHRTPTEQARDRLRDQAHTATGLTSLRFTHGQVRYDPGHVRQVLADVARRLQDVESAA
jgi:very-short-patch-repair endonuclease